MERAEEEVIQRLEAGEGPMGRCSVVDLEDGGSLSVRTESGLSQLRVSLDDSQQESRGPRPTTTGAESCHNLDAPGRGPRAPAVLRSCQIRDFSLMRL